MMPIIQSPSQLFDVYGKDAAQTFTTNHALQIVFPPKASETHTAKDISEWLGYQTVKGVSDADTFVGRVCAGIHPRSDTEKGRLERCGAVRLRQGLGPANNYYILRVAISMKYGSTRIYGLTVEPDKGNGNGSATAENTTHFGNH